MRIDPRSSEAIGRDLMWLRCAQTLVLIVAGGVLGMICIALAAGGAQSAIFIVVGAFLGIASGLWFDRWRWKRWCREIAACYVQDDEGALEVRGIAKSRIRKIRFVYERIACIELGRSRFVGAMSGTVGWLDEQVLVVRETDGRVAEFQLARIIFPEEELIQMLELVADRISSGGTNA